ncbi:hypothetical protein [Rhizobiales bacterium 3FA27D7]|jgi:glutathione synthase/RimK-type ligase-like ATP-grasp enzyme|uniref:ATP-grasp domain-containing protein n=1 Tax=Mesorhizobium sp. 2RAF21 TaxID=3232995 RepID=UPI0010F754B9
MHFPQRVLIVSVKGDLHAAVIRKTISKQIGIDCCIFEVDSIAYSSSITIRDIGKEVEFSFLDSDGVRRQASEFATIWWRRGSREQTIEGIGNLSAAQIDLINNDSSAAFRGGLLAAFDGRWINHPTANAAAEDKILQLEAASRAGFRIPVTLVSQDYNEVRQFLRNLGGEGVLKTLRGTRLQNLLSVAIQTDDIDAVAVNASPAIYQERISGTEHLRIQVFGSNIYCVKISSKEMDWRDNLDIPSVIVEVDETTRGRIFRIMHELNLEMGIIDMKILPSGELVWLEINPQGQFLFLEPMTKFDFKMAFAKFLSGSTVRHIEYVN